MTAWENSMLVMEAMGQPFAEALGGDGAAVMARGTVGNDGDLGTGLVLDSNVVGGTSGGEVQVSYVVEGAGNFLLIIAGTVMPRPYCRPTGTLSYSFG